MVAPFRVFIGSGDASAIERKVLMRSLREHAGRPLEVHVLDGTRNVVTRDGEVVAHLPAVARFRSLVHATEFSLCRYAIPELVANRGTALYLDSDIVCLGDLGELLDTDLSEHELAVVPAAGGGLWALSVLLIDCSRCRFDLDGIFADIRRGLFDYADFSRMSPRFLSRRPYRIQPLAGRWNSFDAPVDGTRLLHFTDLLTQPWRFPGHPCGEVWFGAFEDALRAGEITEEEVAAAARRGFVRPDIRKGNGGDGSFASSLRAAGWRFRERLRRAVA